MIRSSLLFQVCITTQLVTPHLPASTPAKSSRLLPRPSPRCFEEPRIDFIFILTVLNWEYLKLSFIPSLRMFSWSKKEGKPETAGASGSGNVDWKCGLFDPVHDDGEESTVE